MRIKQIEGGHKSMGVVEFLLRRPPLNGLIPISLPELRPFLGISGLNLLLAALNGFVSRLPGEGGFEGLDLLFLEGGVFGGT